MKWTTILVTGGAGFIGSHLVDRLLGPALKRSHGIGKVVCVDNFDPFYDPRLKERNLEGAKKDRRFQLVNVDICDRKALEAVFRKALPQVVVHLAGRAGVRPSLTNPVAYHQTNVEGTLNVLECAREYGSQKLVFGSSSSVYGLSSTLPFAESDALQSPISPYAISKILAEGLCRVFHELCKMPIVCLRFFTVYGPRQRPEMAIAKFAKKILDGEQIDLYGDGSSLRDYTFVEDIVTGIVAAMEKDLQFEIINLGNAKAVPLKKLLKVLEEQTEHPVKIRRMPNQVGDVPVTFASLTKARRLLGYRPKTSIEEGVRRYVEWLGIPPSLHKGTLIGGQIDSTTRTPSRSLQRRGA